MPTRAAIIGCGKRAPSFARACRAVSDVAMVGFADPVEGAAAKLATEFGGTAFTSAASMLARTRPEFVCVVTRPSVRVEPIRLCAEGGVGAVLCEKPMGDSWAAARAVHRIATEAGLLLSFCHQRRLFGSCIEAKRLLDGGAIGEVERIEGYCSNLYDWGTHWFDMFEFLNGDVDAAWVLAQAERRSPRMVFDQPVDTAAVSAIRYSSGATALLIAGQVAPKGAFLRAIGSHGMLVLSPDAGADALVLVTDAGRTLPAYDLTRGPQRAIDVAVADAIACARARRPGTLDSANALRATEQIFASYLSAQRGERIDLPLGDGGEYPLSAFFTR